MKSSCTSCMGALIPSSLERVGRSTFRGGRGFAASSLVAPIFGLSGLSSCSEGGCGCSCGGRSSWAGLPPLTPATGPAEKVNCWASAATAGAAGCAGAAVNVRPPKLGHCESSVCTAAAPPKGAAAPPPTNAGPPKGAAAPPPTNAGPPKGAAEGRATSLGGVGVEETSSSEDSLPDVSPSPSSAASLDSSASSSRRFNSSSVSSQSLPSSVSSLGSDGQVRGASCSGGASPPAGSRLRTFRIPGEGGGTLGSAGSMKPGGYSPPISLSGTLWAREYRSRRASEVSKQSTGPAGRYRPGFVGSRTVA